MVGVVILNYNGATNTIECVDSLIRYNSYPCKIVIVDNASTDDSVQRLETYSKSNDVDVICANENCGYAQGNNIGIMHFENDLDVDEILILNNDVLFTKDIIPGLVSRLNSLPDAGIVSPLLYTGVGDEIDYCCARRSPENSFVIKTFLFQYYDCFKYISKTRNSYKILLNASELLEEDSLPIELPSGSCMLIKKDLFNEIGKFDPGTFLYYEENILYRKLLHRGKVNYVCPSLSCIHLGGQSTSKKPVRFLKVKEAESARYYLEKYGEMSLKERAIASIAFPLFFFRMNLTATIHRLFKY